MVPHSPNTIRKESLEWQISMVSSKRYIQRVITDGKIPISCDEGCTGRTRRRRILKLCPVSMMCPFASKAALCCGSSQALHVIFILDGQFLFSFMRIEEYRKNITSLCSPMKPQYFNHNEYKENKELIWALYYMLIQLQH